MQEPILIYIEKLTPRIDYIFKFIFKSLFDIPFAFTTSLNKVRSYDGVFINYSDDNTLGGLHIQPQGLLHQDNISEQFILMTQWKELPIFFNTGGSHLPFDIFSASFYLLSRYEEYSSKEVDEHGRFRHTDSLAYQKQFLQLPLINLWCVQWYALLQVHFKSLPIKSKGIKSKRFTYDIDMISSYTNKGFKRNVGGVLKAFKQFDFKQVGKRVKVLLGIAKDPFDTFDEIINLLGKERAIFFILCAKKVGQYDKNSSPFHKATHAVIEKIQKAGHEIAIHPSYHAALDQTLTQNEKSILEKISGTTILKSRQHYIRQRYPETIVGLQSLGIKEDYSLGYGSINGYRASTGTPHFFFDLNNNKMVPINIHPFCWMDANSFYEQKLTVSEAKEELAHYLHQAYIANDYFTCIWHNYSLHNEDEWLGWKGLHDGLF